MNSDRTDHLRAEALDHFFVKAIQQNPHLGRLSPKTQKKLDAFLARNPTHRLNKSKAS